MAERLKQLNQKRYEGILEFMQALKRADFTNEFDNARVLKVLTEKVDEAWSLVNRKGRIYITSETKQSNLHGTDLVVIVHSTENMAVQLPTILFVRPDRQSLAIYTNVLSEQIKMGQNDIPVGGVDVNWEEAQKIFRENPRFDEQAFLIFKAVYESIQKPNENIACVIHMTPQPSHLSVNYRLGGNKVIDMRFGYNK